MTRRNIVFVHGYDSSNSDSTDSDLLDLESDSDSNDYDFPDLASGLDSNDHDLPDLVGIHLLAREEGEHRFQYHRFENEQEITLLQPVLSNENDDFERIIRNSLKAPRLYGDT